jgi:hypothetical protein
MSPSRRAVANPRRIRRASARGLVALALLFSVHGSALAWTELTGSLEPIDLGAWDGVSSPSQASPSVCVLATATQKNDDPAGIYRAKARSRPVTGGAWDTAFLLHKDNDPTITVPMTVEWLGANLNVNNLGAVSRTLSPDTWTAYVFGGRNDQQCKNGTFGDNGQLVITVDNGALQSLPPGTYTAELEIDLLANQIPGSQIKNIPALVYPVLVIPGQVKIGNIDDIVLNWSGIGDLTYNEPFCVYSNTGGYSLTASTTTLHQSDPNSFALENTVVAGDTVPYTVQVDNSANADASTGPTVLNGQQLSGLVGEPVELDCVSGGDNAAVFIRMLESDLQGLTGSAYSGTLTLTVEPI